MAKIRTASALQDFLDKDFGWRIIELSNYGFALKQAKKENIIGQKVLARAAVPLIYAHWEGFIKNSAEAYVNFISNQTNNFEQLITCFVVLGLKKHINDIKQTKKTKLNIETVDFIREGLKKPVSINLESAINTESNLRSHVFENIALTIGIDPTPYEAKYNFIDQRLVDRRNSIAHGNYLVIEPEEFKEISDEVIGLLRSFKNDIQNAVSLASYKISVS